MLSIIAEKMNSIFNKHDYKKNYVYEIKKYLSPVTDVLNKLFQNNVNYYLIGGSVYAKITDSRNFFSDYDLFFETEEDFNKAKEYLTAHFKVLSDTNNAITFKTLVHGIFDGKPIQIIRKVFGNFDEICNTFDISNSCIGISKNNDVLFGANFSRDYEIIDKNICIKSLNRCIKYLNKDKLSGALEYSDKFATQIEKYFNYILNFDDDYICESFYGDNKSNIKNYLFESAILIISESFFEYYKKLKGKKLERVTKLVFNNKTFNHIAILTCSKYMQNEKNINFEILKQFHKYYMLPVVNEINSDSDLNKERKYVSGNIILTTYNKNIEKIKEYFPEDFI